MAKNIKNIRYDILQGSFLGPLPFLIFVNDLQYEANILSPIMFTDDTSFFPWIITYITCLKQLIKQSNCSCMVLFE